jgi:hypothetical protein
MEANESPFSTTVDLLDAIPGVNRRTAEVIVAEIGRRGSALGPWLSSIISSSAMSVLGTGRGRGLLFWNANKRTLTNAGSFISSNAWATTSSSNPNRPLRADFHLSILECTFSWVLQVHEHEDAAAKIPGFDMCSVCRPLFGLARVVIS